MGDKDRSDWFHDRTSYSKSEPDALKLARYRMELDPGEADWRCVGPNNFGGRVTSLAVDPRDPLHVYAGSAAGGVWESFDGGLSWKAVWSKQETLNVGSLAIDPQTPDVVYCGTGEGNLSGDSYPGVGIYRYSALDKKGWQWISLNGSTRIGTLAVDPFDSNRIALGSVNLTDEDFATCTIVELHELDNGEFNRTIGDSTVLGGIPVFRCHSVVFDHSARGRLYCAIDARGSQSGIWRSDDGGVSWKPLQRGLPPSEMFGRTSLAISPSDPNVLYAFAGDRKNRVLGVFRSDDSGKLWRVISGHHFRNERELGYCNCIAVDPSDPNFLICGGVDLHRSRNGGQTWEQLTEWDLPEANRNYAHADHHAIVIPRPGLVYDANDGGVDVSEDGGDSWQNRSKGLVISMFYDLDVAASERDVFGGGVQDNGSLVHSVGEKPGEFFKVLPGDGGWMLFDPTDPNHIYATSQNMSIHRRVGGGSFDDVTPFQATDEERQAVWMSFLAMDDSETSADPRPVFAGSTRVWKTVDDGEHWEPVSEELDGSEITALEVSSVNPWLIFAGTKKGGVFRSIDRGNNWSESLAGVEIPRQTISRIACHPQNSQVAMLTVPVSPKTPWVVGGSDGLPIENYYPHVFLSLDAGFTWKDADPKRQLPDVAYTSLCFHTKFPSRVFLGSALGVHQGDWKGTTFEWGLLTGRLPNVLVTDVVYHELTDSLFAATYGRGVWRLELKPKTKKASPKRKKAEK